MEYEINIYNALNKYWLYTNRQSTKALFNFVFEHVFCHIS